MLAHVAAAVVPLLCSKTPGPGHTRSWWVGVWEPFCTWKLIPYLSLCHCLCPAPEICHMRSLQRAMNQTWSTPLNMCPAPWDVSRPHVPHIPERHHASCRL